MQRGSVSVFLALLLTAVLVFALTLAESARIGGLRVNARLAGDGAIDSVFSAYDRVLLEDYGLLFYDSGKGRGLTQYDEIEQEFETYFKKNTEGGFFGITECDAQITGLVAATDYNGELFIRSALAYYKYEGVTELLDMLTEGKRAVDQAEATERHDDAVTSDVLGDVMSMVPKASPSAILISASKNADSGDSSRDDAGDASDAEGYDAEKYDETINKSIIGSAERVRVKGWMNLVLPDGGTVSGISIETDDLPSVSAVDGRSFETEGIAERAAEKAVFDEYLLSVFPCFTDEGREKGLQYETEYLLYGKNSDDENLKAALNRLIWIREGCNLIYAAADTELQSQTKEMAEAMVGWTGVEALIPVVQAALIAAWSYAETLADLRILMSGGKIPLYKTKESVSLSLGNVAGFLSGGSIDLSKNEEGLTYRDYLRVLLYMSDMNELAYHAMDLIQVRMQQKNSGFLMTSQVYALELRTEIRAQALFTAMPLVLGMTGKHRGLTGGAVSGSDSDEAYVWEEYFSMVYQ